MNIAAHSRSRAHTHTHSIVRNTAAAASKRNRNAWFGLFGLILMFHKVDSRGDYISRMTTKKKKLINEQQCIYKYFEICSISILVQMMKNNDTHTKHTTHDASWFHINCICFRICNPFSFYFVFCLAFWLFIYFHIRFLYCRAVCLFIFWLMLNVMSEKKLFRLDLVVVFPTEGGA